MDGHFVGKFVTLLAFVGAVTLIAGLAVIRAWPRKTRTGTRHVVILVLGDIGRSPRMQYHAESCIQEGWSVDFVGYSGSAPLASLLGAQEAKRLDFHHLPTPEKLDSLSKLDYFARAGVRVVTQVMQLLYTLLFNCCKPDAILVQTPPAIPTLAIAHIVRLLFGCKLVIDWHNTSSSILATKSANRHLVRIMDLYEIFMAKIGDFYGQVEHLTVCRGMKDKMMDVWAISQPIHVMYDRPPARFSRLSQSDADTFLTRFKPPPSVNSRQSTTGSEAMIVSSTSWTEDEDFSILLEALKLYESTKSLSIKELPDLSVYITGRGPQQEHYKQIMSKLQLQHVSIRTVWLEPEDYPLLLGCVDVGISLHTSSSGLDLPMKIVDMFGSGLPVIALDYPVLRSEMVHDGVNGLLARDAASMADNLVSLLSDFRKPHSRIDEMRTSIITEFTAKRWETEWKRVVHPILR